MSDLDKTTILASKLNLKSLKALLEIVEYVAEEIIIKIFYNFHQGSMRKKHKSMFRVY